MCGAFAWQVTALATQFNAKLTLLHVEPENRTNNANPKSLANQLSGFSTLIGEQLEPHRVSRKVISGDVAANIIREADSGSADLIMIPSRERRGLRRFFEPPMVERTLRQSRCAVWTVSSNQAASCSQFRNIVCAVDLKSDSARVLKAAARIADQLNGTLSVVHVLPEFDESLLHLAAMHDLPVTFSPEVVKKEIQSMQPSIQNSADIYIEYSDISSGIQRVLRRLNADLLVIGPGRHSGHEGNLGAHVVPLVRSVECPVLVLSKPGVSTIYRPKRDSAALFEAVN